MKKILILALLMVSFVFVTSVKASTIESECVDGSCNPVEIVNRYTNEEGEIVRETTDGITMIEKADGTLIVRVPEQMVNVEYVESRAGGILICAMVLKVIIKAGAKIIASCATVDYVTGHDVCREISAAVLDGFSNISVSGDYEYKCYGKLIKDPECVPPHSPQCAGYWEYTYEPQF